jgi:myo-inositol-1(or 4)-monophosphatase
MHPYLNIATRAATEAGRVILRSLNKLDSIKVESKGRNDFVSEVDFQAEQTIINVLKSAYPEHSIMAEETGESGDSEFQWIIDPLDGTTNFLHGFPMYAVSIAMVHKGEVRHAVVYDLLKDELFHASEGEGAFLNQKRIRVSHCKDMSKSLLGTGFPFKNMDMLDDYLTLFREIFPQSSGVRRAGSAALDLSYVAAGRLDGFWEYGLKPWDIAAGTLLIKEAGGVISDFAGKGEYLASGNVVAGNLAIHGKLLEIINNLESS